MAKRADALIKADSAVRLQSAKKQDGSSKTLNVERYVIPTKAQALALLKRINTAFKPDNVDRFKESLSAEQKRQALAVLDSRGGKRLPFCVNYVQKRKRFRIFSPKAANLLCLSWKNDIAVVFNPRF
ncbi:hypothetical protein AI2615V1_2922 [Enterobacter cloacae]|nr:hypothetical protein AI2615V1_2922 [Enterobacter cloacae]CAH3672421.1 hypothetical protein AI2615V1_2922 [Enterobacter cloacae]